MQSFVQSFARLPAAKPVLATLLAARRNTMKLPQSFYQKPRTRRVKMGKRHVHPGPDEDAATAKYHT